jgi:hypothetical protein
LKTFFALPYLSPFVFLLQIFAKFILASGAENKKKVARQAFSHRGRGVLCKAHKFRAKKAEIKLFTPKTGFFGAFALDFSHFFCFSFHFYQVFFVLLFTFLLKCFIIYLLCISRVFAGLWFGLLNFTPAG